LPRYPRLYRVFPWLEDAPAGEPGHPLYVAHPQGHGRIDNPEHYLTLYASDRREGAIGEAFGNHAMWTRDLLDGPPALPGSRRALATYDAPRAEIIDLDDPQVLVERELRPSGVVTRDRRRTQTWALDVYREQTWDGVRWWSFHDPDWGSFGLWNRDALEVASVDALSEEVELVQEVASRMYRVWAP
jgi:RES domain